MIGDALPALSARRDIRMNIRVNGHDMQALQQIALKQEIPLQSLISSILHHYVEVNADNVDLNEGKQKNTLLDVISNSEAKVLNKFNK